MGSMIDIYRGILLKIAGMLGERPGSKDLRSKLLRENGMLCFLSEDSGMDTKIIGVVKISDVFQIGIESVIDENT